MQGTDIEDAYFWCPELFIQIDAHNVEYVFLEDLYILVGLRHFGSHHMLNPHCLCLPQMLCNIWEDLLLLDS